MTTNTNNKNEQKIIQFGSDLKLLFSIESDEIVSMEGIDFFVEIIFNGKSLTLRKNQLVKIDDKNYIACIKSNLTAKGSLSAQVTLLIPDNKFEDGVRAVVKKIYTNLIIQ